MGLVLVALLLVSCNGTFVVTRGMFKCPTVKRKKKRKLTEKDNIKIQNGKAFSLIQIKYGRRKFEDDGQQAKATTTTVGLHKEQKIKSRLENQNVRSCTSV